MLMLLQLSIACRRVKYVVAEISLDATQVNRALTFPPDSISGKLLDFRKEEWFADLEQTEAGTLTVQQDANVVLVEIGPRRLVKTRSYGFTSLGSEGTFGLRLQPCHPLPIGR
jgi:hypothetical protein